eukprot:8085_1
MQANQKYEFQLIIDSREKLIIANKNAFKMSICVSMLPIGDFMIVTRNRKTNETSVIDAIIERKTFSDFGASCYDNRYDTQKALLLYSSFHNKCFLFEKNGGYKQQTYNIQSAMTKLEKKGFSISNTSNVQHSIEFINGWFHKYTTQEHIQWLTIQNKKKTFGQFNSYFSKIRHLVNGIVCIKGWTIEKSVIFAYAIGSQHRLHDIVAHEKLMEYLLIKNHSGKTIITKNDLKALANSVLCGIQCKDDVSNEIKKKKNKKRTTRNQNKCLQSNINQPLAKKRKPNK